MADVTLDDAAQTALIHLATQLAGAVHGAFIREALNHVGGPTSFLAEAIPEYDTAWGEMLDAELDGLHPKYLAQVAHPVDPMVVLPADVTWMNEKKVNRERVTQGLAERPLTVDFEAPVNETPTT